VAVTLGEITDRNRAAVLEYPHAKPWYRAVCADGGPVGFVTADVGLVA
jgi:hypothetical protein